MAVWLPNPRSPVLALPPRRRRFTLTKVESSDAENFTREEAAVFPSDPASGQSVLSPEAAVAGGIEGWRWCAGVRHCGHQCPSFPDREGHRSVRS